MEATELWRFDIVNLTMSALTIVALIYFGMKRRVYRNYSSMLIVTIFTLSFLDQVVMTITRLSGVYSSPEKLQDARFVN